METAVMVGAVAPAAAIDSDGSLAVKRTAVERSTQDGRLRLSQRDSTDRPTAVVDAPLGDIVTWEAPK